MGWADKELKKNKIRKLVEQAMKDPKYADERKKYGMIAMRDHSVHFF